MIPQGKEQEKSDLSCPKTTPKTVEMGDSRKRFEPHVLRFSFRLLKCDTGKDPESRDPSDGTRTVESL